LTINNRLNSYSKEMPEDESERSSGLALENQDIMIKWAILVNRLAIEIRRKIVERAARFRCHRATWDDFEGKKRQWALGAFFACIGSGKG
jgi:hypothetical protein